MLTTLSEQTEVWGMHGRGRQQGEAREDQCKRGLMESIFPPSN